MYKRNNAETVGKVVYGIDYARREMHLPLKIFVEAVKHSKEYKVPAKKVNILREAVGETLLKILMPSNFEASLEEITEETKLSVKDLKTIKKNYHAYLLSWGVRNYLEENLSKTRKAHRSN